jgi:hypothetical protein
MVIFREGDLSVFLQDFGETMTWGGGEAKVLFDNEYVAASLLGIDIETSHPMANGDLFRT